MTRTLVFSTQAYDYLGRAVAASTGWDLGVVARKTFPDGEHYLRIETDPTDRDVVLVGGTTGDQATLELYDLACGLVTGGEVVTAKTRARLLSSIPMASRGTQVFLLDLHVAAIAHYFEGGIRPIHVYGKSLVTAAARRLGGDDFVLACTDAGRAKWVESLANDLNVAAAFVYKRRHDDATEVTGVSAQVGGKRVVIYDDMIRTGGSLLNAAKAYRDAGAVAIDAIATHGLFPGDSLARIEQSGLLGRIVVTDSHPRAVALQNHFLQVDSTAALLAEHLLSNC
jgi:ribose-phosphate pyrophosphokinase